MPEIDLIPEVLQQSSNPYHFLYDNLPLTNILQRIDLVNDAVDANTLILTQAIGTQGTLANRLAQSINPDGSLITTAIDAAMHGIGNHTDDATYVRMLGTERSKLATVAASATSLQLSVASTTYSNSTVTFVNTDTITWSIPSSNQIQANFAFPADAAHQHFYDVVPTPQNVGSPDYQNYQTTSMATPCMDGTLRVTINGIKLSSTANVYVPPSTGPTGSWTPTTFTPNEADGTFELSRAITIADVIRIDFDTSY